MPAAMATRYTTSRGQQIQLGAKIGSGGEGHVYECVGRPDLVAKIYHRAPSPEHSRKLQAMVSMCTPALEQIAAWPTDTISSSSNGALVGLLMKRFSKDYLEIIHLYNPTDRKKYFANVDFSFLVHTAWNLAAAFDTMHKAGVVIGDVNQKNILVNPQAFIRLIDCDSFQVVHNGEKFRCRVGVVDYTPPELQSKDFGKIDRSENHDNFGLAVVIFSLLMMGRHPFAGVTIGRAPIDLTRAIQEFHFAYSTSKLASNILAPPPNAPPIDLLPASLVTMLEKAFSQISAANAGRPSAAEWLSELDKFRSNILVCPKNNIHKFGQHRSSCPWCDFEMRSIVFFAGSASRQVNIPTGWSIDRNLISETHQHIKRLRVLCAPPPGNLPAAYAGALSSDILAARRARTSIRFSFVLFILCACLGLIGSYSPLLWIIFIVWWINEESDRNAFVKEEIRRKQNYALCSAEHEARQKAIQNLQIASQNLRGTLDNTEKLLAEYEQIPRRYEDEKRKLESEKRNVQEKIYLQGFTIDAASIPNFGPNRKAILRSFGFYTAADIEQAAISGIPGLGETLQENLLNWKRKLIQGFYFDPSKPIPQTELDALRSKCSSRASILNTELNARRKQLQREINKLDPALSKLLAEHSQSAFLLAQAKVELEALK